jgi:hypothetical protein
LYFPNPNSTALIPVNGAVEDQIHFAFWLTSGSDFRLYFLANAVNVNCHISFESDNRVRLYLGVGTLVATSVDTISSDTWHTAKVIITARDAAGGGRLRVFIDGNPTAIVDTGAGVNMRATAIDDFLNVYFYCVNAPDCWLDDFVHASSGSLPDQALYIKLLRPTADDTPTDSTPSTGTDQYAMVDESPVSLLDYNELTVAGNEDHLAASDLGAVPGDILAVRVLAHATGVGVITQMRTLVKSNGTTGYGVNQGLSTGGTYTDISDIFETDPDTGLAWEPAAVDAMFIGYEAN